MSFAALAFDQNAAVKEQNQRKNKLKSSKDEFWNTSCKVERRVLIFFHWDSLASKQTINIRECSVI